MVRDYHKVTEDQRKQLVHLTVDNRIMSVNKASAAIGLKYSTAKKVYQREMLYREIKHRQ